jgi:hypothetical protein
MGTCTPCILYCDIADTCGRTWYQEHELIVCPASTLGLTLKNFNGSKSGSDNILTWTTEMEINAGRFELELSRNGSNYEKIAAIPAIGNGTGTQDYTYTHLSQEKSGWYRLKIIDRDGNSKYSGIVAINRSESKLMVSAAYPNPFTKQMTVSIQSEYSGLTNLRLSSMSGRLVRDINVNLHKGSNNIEITGLDHLQEGIYFLRVTSQDGSSSMRLLKTYQ